MADPAYEAAVKETFETKPLRTVLMIDDEFPTFSDLAKGPTKENEKRFRQKDRAARLYEAFQGRDMICDVENVASAIQQADRFRKSDLIILDFHLGPGESDSDKAIQILRGLSVSKHFNTVVVYTAETDLNKVWLDIVASLGGGWAVLPAALTGSAQQHWERLADEKKLPSPPLEVVMAYAKRRRIRDLPQASREAMQAELVALEVPPKDCGSIIEALIHRELADRSGNYAKEPQHAAVGDFESGKHWIQSGNAFVTLLNKGDDAAGASDADAIMSRLSDALLSWRPNLIQILISEIQNILEQEALATEDHHLRDPVTQTALWYYLLDALGPVDPAAEPDVSAPLMGVIDKIVDGVRRRLSSDPDLLKLASQALLGELRGTGWAQDTWPKPRHSTMHKAATDIARTGDLVKAPETLFRLNSFFSTEKFRRAHLTTGTIFHHGAKDEYFVAASPACDLVSRRPPDEQSWTNAIFPFTPVVAILLRPVTDIQEALVEAANGLHIFLESGTDKKAFKVVAGPGHQPSYEFFMIKNEGKVREVEGKKVFDGARLAPKLTAAQAGQAAIVSDSQREWVDDTFEIVDQLRGMNATRILQLAGQHLSRIGLDYISLPAG